MSKRTFGSLQECDDDDAQLPVPVQPVQSLPKSARQLADDFKDANGIIFRRCYGQCKIDDTLKPRTTKYFCTASDTSSGFEGRCKDCARLGIRARKKVSDSDSYIARRAIAVLTMCVNHCA